MNGDFSSKAFYLGAMCGNQVFQRIRDSAYSILPLEAAVPFRELATTASRASPLVSVVSWL